MKKTILLAFVALAMALAPAASAQDFLDLPGMGSASELAPAGEGITEGDPADEAVTAEAVAAEAAGDTAATTAETVTDEVDSGMVETITALPGGGSLPAIGGIEVGVAAASGEAANGPSRGTLILTFLAGLGSLASVTWLVSLRRQGVV